jgi:hypothetical protein
LIVLDSRPWKRRARPQPDTCGFSQIVTGVNRHARRKSVRQRRFVGRFSPEVIMPYWLFVVLVLLKIAIELAIAFAR